MWASSKKICSMVRARMTSPMEINILVVSWRAKDTVKAAIFTPMEIDMWVGLKKVKKADPVNMNLRMATVTSADLSLINLKARELTTLLMAINMLVNFVMAKNMGKAPMFGQMETDMRALIRPMF